jgi:hypothetical protein
MIDETELFFRGVLHRKHGKECTPRPF